MSKSRSLDSRDRSRDRKHHSSSHKKSKKRHRSRSPDSPYQSYSAPVEKHKKVRYLNVCVDAHGSIIVSTRRKVKYHTPLVEYRCWLG